MTKIHPTWLEAFDKELLHLFAIRRPPEIE